MSVGIRELPGEIYHWTALHPRIQSRVSSHFLGGSATVLDPLLPQGEGPGWLEQAGRPERIVLTIRHHLRGSEELAEHFGCPILCSREGLHEFEGGPDVDGFGPGDQLGPGVRALAFGAISPDDVALHIGAGPGYIAFGDGLVNHGGPRYVSDGLLGEDPEAVKRDLDAGLQLLLEEDFDGLLFAHGEPITAGGKNALRRFVESR
jgi:hypothetical protein